MNGPGLQIRVRIVNYFISRPKRRSSYGQRCQFDLQNTCNNSHSLPRYLQRWYVLDFSLTVKATSLIFISGRGSAISSAKEGKSGFIYKLVNS